VKKPPQERGPRTYTVASKKPVKPITKEMQEGKEPLRTFGDLKQFFENRDSGEATE
jgi:hypothetical protein